MYDELVKSIHCCFGFDSMQTDCENCMMKDKREEYNYEGCCDALGLAAADAIEQLQKDLERSKEYEAFWEKEASEALRKFQVAISSKHRWIPVTERLPCLTTPVLATDGIEVDIAWMYGVPPRWITSFTAIDEDKLTHWMPLPQTPKEE